MVSVRKSTSELLFVRFCVRKITVFITVFFFFCKISMPLVLLDSCADKSLVYRVVIPLGSSVLERLFEFSAVDCPK
jgi:hypothetical protein